MFPSKLVEVLQLQPATHHLHIQPVSPLGEEARAAAGFTVQGELGLKGGLAEHPRAEGMEDSLHRRSPGARIPLHRPLGQKTHQAQSAGSVLSMEVKVPRLHT
eukprot:8992348-Lingulodinium_polyedra.AAC.1